MIRVVFDTNIIVSAFLWGGQPRRALERSLQASAVIIGTEVMLLELERTLQKPKLAQYVAYSQKTAGALVESYRQLIVISEEIEISKDVIRDPQDVIVLSAAKGGRASHIVTGDKDLLVLNPYQGIAIMRPADYIDVIDAAGD